jgi:DNA-binding IclR family transcriptional regulator
MDPQNNVKSVARAIKIIECFSESKFELDLSEIVHKTNLPKATVHRILATLKNGGLVSQDLESRKYKLGLKLFELGSLVFGKLKLREAALPFIEELSEKCGETVHLGILDKEEVISIEKADSSFSLRSSIYIGKRAPAYCTGVGKALLAFQPPDKMRLFLQSKAKKYTANTITEANKLEEELGRVRKEGFAVDNMEHEEGVRCVAAPIRNYEGKVIASVSISGPSIRITEEKILQLALMVKETARNISKELGFSKTQD